MEAAGWKRLDVESPMRCDGSCSVDGANGFAKTACGVKGHRSGGIRGLGDREQFLPPMMRLGKAFFLEICLKWRRLLLREAVAVGLFGEAECKTPQRNADGMQYVETKNRGVVCA